METPDTTVEQDLDTLARLAEQRRQALRLLLAFSDKRPLVLWGCGGCGSGHDAVVLPPQPAGDRRDLRSLRLVGGSMGHRAPR